MLDLLHDGRPTGSLAEIHKQHQEVHAHIKEAGQIFQLKQEIKHLSKEYETTRAELLTAKMENGNLRLEIENSKKVVVAPVPVSRPYVIFRQTPTFEDILLIVSDFYCVTPLDIKSARRTADVIRPRQVFMFLSYALTERAYPQIGLFLGGRDHTTALHGKRKIEGRIMAGDTRLKDEIDILKIKLGELMAIRNAGLEVENVSTH